LQFFHDGALIEEGYPIPDAPKLLNLSNTLQDVHQQREECWRRIQEENIDIPFRF